MIIFGGTQSILYAKEYGDSVTGINFSEEMVESATTMPSKKRIGNKVKSQVGDSQSLPFSNLLQGKLGYALYKGEK